MTSEHFDRDFYQSYMETSYDRSSSSYDQTVSYWWRDGRDPRRFLHQLLAQRLRPDSALLDVATGTGRIALEVAPAIPQGRVVGLDQSEQMLEQARAKAREAGLQNLSFERYSVESELPCRDRSFDLVTCSLALVYFQDRPAFIREAARVLRPGGALILNTIGPGDMHNVLKPFWQIFLQYLPDFTSDFRAHTASEELAGWLGAAGLTAVETHSHSETVVFASREDFLALWRTYGIQGVLFFLPRATARTVMTEYVATLDGLCNGDGALEVEREIVTGIGLRPAEESPA